MRFIQNWQYARSGGLDTIDLVLAKPCLLNSCVFVIVTNDFTTALGATYVVSDDVGSNLYDESVLIDGGHYGVHIFQSPGVIGGPQTISIFASAAGDFTARVAETSHLSAVSIPDATGTATGTGTLVSLAGFTPPGAAVVLAGIAQDQGGQIFTPLPEWMAVADGLGGEGAYRTTLGSGVLPVGWTLGSSATWYLAAAAFIDESGANNDGVAWMPVGPAIGGCRRVAIPSGMGD